MSGRMRARWIAWGGVGLWAALIFAASSVPGSNVPGRFGALAHFVEYAVFGGLLFIAYRADVPARRAIVLAIVTASLYGITDEFHQSFVPMRMPDPMDWLVDTLGAITGALVAAGVTRQVLRHRESRNEG